MKNGWKFLLFIALICVIIGAVSAESDQFTISGGSIQSYSQITSQYFAVSGSSGTFATNSLGMSFSQLNDPTYEVIQFNGGVTPYTAQSGTFTATYGGLTTATGTYNLANGTFSGYNMELTLAFSYYNNQGNTGTLQNVVTFSPALPPTQSSTYVGNSLSYSLMPLQFEVYYPGYGYYPLYGVYYLNDATGGSAAFNATDNGGTNVITFNVTKNGLSLTTVYNSTSGSIVYQEPGTANNNPLLNVVIANQRPLIFNSNFYGITPVNSSVYFTNTGNYSISFNPQTPSPGQQITPTIYKNGYALSTIPTTTLQYIHIEDDTTTPNNVVLSNTANYNPLMTGFDYLWNSHNTGNWQYYNLTSGYIGNLTTSLTLAGFTLKTSGNHNISTTLEDTNNNWYYLDTIIPVSGNIGQATLSIYPINYNTQALVLGTQIGVSPAGNGTYTWTNVTVSSITSCQFQVNPGGNYIYQITPPSGYLVNSGGVLTATPAAVTTYVGGNSVISVNLYPSGSGITNTIASFNVVTSTSPYPSISGASVTVTGTGFSQTVLTSASGAPAVFNLTNNTAYTATASATGYQPSSMQFTTSAAQYYTTIALTPGALVPTATPIPTVTATTTIPGYSSSTGNYTGFFAPIENGIASAGALPSEMGLLMAALFIFVGACLGGLRGDGSGIHPVGAGIGGAIGFVLACAFGLISFIWVAAFVFVAVAIAILFGRG